MFLYIVARLCDKECDMRSMAGTELPRTRREAWNQHKRNATKLAEERNWRPGRLEWMLERDRASYKAGVWPWSQYLEGGRPTDDEIRAAIIKRIAENRGIGERRLWPMIQDDFPGCDIPRKIIRDLLREIRSGEI